ncbi:MAG: sodium-independent anion transporter, partial [Candidatus Omnitrophica bacterium]|nr:sodium-independent anion transporter [Candidatus Omnitrophota bacterium]
IQGPFFFGVVSTFLETMNNIEERPKVRILRMRHVTSIDATALNALRQVILKSKKIGIRLILSGVDQEILNTLKTSGINDIIGNENIVPHIDAALNYARELLKQ